MRLHNPFLPVLGGLFLILQILFPSRVWVILLIMLGGAWLISFFWAHSLQRNLSFRRAMVSGWVQVGDRLQEQFLLFNRGLAPALWVELDDRSNLPGYNASRITGVGFLSSTTWQGGGVCTRRGLYTLGPTALQTGDPFGLYTVTLRRPETSLLMVLPPVVALPQIEIAPRLRAGEGRRARSSFVERSISASGVREYQHGDRSNWIHWPSTARRGQVYVRQFDSLPAGDWWILLDLDRQVQAGEGASTTEEHGVILAASLADRGLRERRRVGLVTHGPDLVWLPPEGGVDQRMNLLRALAVASPGETSLARLLSSLGPALGRGASLVVITPAVEGPWIEALLSLVDRGVVPTVLLLDPASFGGRGNVQAAAATLADFHIAFHCIARALLDPPESVSGRPERARLHRKGQVP